MQTGTDGALDIAQYALHGFPMYLCRLGEKLTHLVDSEGNIRPSES